MTDHVFATYAATAVGKGWFQSYNTKGFARESCAAWRMNALSLSYLSPLFSQWATPNLSHAPTAGAAAATAAQLGLNGTRG